MLTGVQIIDAVYCGLWACVILALLVGEWGFGHEGVAAAIWILMFFGSPWWGSAACALSGSGLSLCRCCSPTTALQVGFTLCLIGVHKVKMEMARMHESQGRPSLENIVG